MSRHENNVANPNYITHERKGGQLYLVVHLNGTMWNDKDETLLEFHFLSTSVSSSTCLIGPVLVADNAMFPNPLLFLSMS